MINQRIDQKLSVKQEMKQEAVILHEIKDYSYLETEVKANTVDISKLYT
mgnify:FL=1